MVVTGYYNASPTVARGFVRQSDGTITTFDAGNNPWTEPEGINDAGEITGYFLISDGAGLVPESFIRYPDGHIIILNPPAMVVMNTRSR